MEGSDAGSWRKSSYSGNNGGNCIEVAAATDRVLIRDSKDSAGPRLAFTPDAWQAFAEAVKDA